MPRIAVLGPTTVDLVARPGGALERRPGGSVLFAARSLAEAGDPPAVATRCHDGRLVAEIAVHAAPLCLRLDGEQMVSELRYRPDGERDHRLGGLSRPFTPEDLETWAAPALREARWVHAGTQHAGDLGAPVLAALAAGGRSIALDAQGPLRPARLGPVSLVGPLAPELLAPVQALKLSEEEAEAAFGTVDAVEIRRRSGVPEVVVTLGAVGALVAGPDGDGHVEARVVEDADPTGAGDAFLALYAHARAAGAGPLAAADEATRGVARLLAARLAA